VPADLTRRAEAGYNARTAGDGSNGYQRPRPEDAGVRWEIRSSLDEIDPALEKLAGLVHGLRFDGDTRDNIELALREALANAIVHGNRSALDKLVRIESTIEAGELVVRVFDQGAGFEPDQVPDPRAPENLLKPGGRGLLLMRAFMDRVEFRYVPGSGMAVTLRKSLPPREETEI
jgi:serine/threonine-protein kinase RsbW